MKFGEKVRAARLAAHYSQRQLADMTGIALRTIQNYESGERLRGHGCHDESDSGGLLDCKRKEPEVRAQKVQKHFRQQFRFIRASHIYNGE